MANKVRLLGKKVGKDENLRFSPYYEIPVGPITFVFECTDSQKKRKQILIAKAMGIIAFFSEKNILGVIFSFF